MLAAMSARSDPTLSLFLLALLMADKKEQASPALKAYFDETLSQAKALLENPQLSATDISPDAIKLAFRIGRDAKVREALFQVPDFNGLSEPIAADVLHKMELELEGTG